MTNISSKLKVIRFVETFSVVENGSNEDRWTLIENGNAGLQKDLFIGKDRIELYQGKREKKKICIFMKFVHSIEKFHQQHRRYYQVSFGFAAKKISEKNIL